MGDLRLQAGPQSLDGSLDPKLGILAVKIKCWAPDLLTAVTGRAPDFGLSGLIEYQPRTFSRGVAGEQQGYDVSLTFEGHLSPDDADGEEFELSGDLSEDPVESHPDFDLLITNYNGTADDGNGRAKWPTTLADALSSSGTRTNSAGEAQLSLGTDLVVGSSADATRNPMHGVESYRVPSAIWTRTWVSRRLPKGLIQELATLTSEVPGNDAPELVGREQWLCVRITGTFRGNIWKLRQSWQKTGPHGIAPELYRRFVRA